MGRFILDIPDDILTKWTERMFGEDALAEDEILRRLSSMDPDARKSIVVVKEATP